MHRSCFGYLTSKIYLYSGGIPSSFGVDQANAYIVQGVNPFLPARIHRIPASVMAITGIPADNNDCL